jgi:mono/diheme cytochrome c family protein
MLKRVLIAVGLGAALAWGSWATAATPYPSADLTQIAKTGKYVGSKACLECHEDEHKSWAARATR